MLARQPWTSLIWFILGYALNSMKFSSQLSRLYVKNYPIFVSRFIMNTYVSNTLGVVLPLVEKPRDVAIGTIPKEIRAYKKYSGPEVRRMDAQCCL